MQAQAYSSRKLYMRIAAQIRDAIERGDLRPGDRLPPLAEMAAGFNCSRATVREALSTLRGQGLVEFQHGNGIYVRTAALETWMEPLEAAMLMGQGDILQLVETQTAILAGVASSVALRSKEVDFDKLNQSLFQLECAPPGGEEAIASELSFYLTLADSSGNSMLENAFRVLLEAVRSTLRLLQNSVESGKETCRNLLDATMKGDAERARQQVYERGHVLRERVLTIYPRETTSGKTVTREALNHQNDQETQNAETHSEQTKSDLFEN